MICPAFFPPIERRVQTAYTALKNLVHFTEVRQNSNFIPRQVNKTFFSKPLLKSHMQKARQKVSPAVHGDFLNPTLISAFARLLVQTFPTFSFPHLFHSQPTAYPAHRILQKAFDISYSEVINPAPEEPI